MYWADKLADKIIREKKSEIESGKTLIIRDEKTASGRVHVGSLRGVAIHGILSEILTERGIKNGYLYEINDMDPMDGMPVYLDEKKYAEHMGKPLFTIPAPDGKSKNFAEQFGREFEDVIRKLGFNPTFYRLSDEYKAGKFNDVIRLALEHADVIRGIYKKVSGSEKSEDWMPLNVICEKCGKIGTTKVTAFDGKEVTYRCEENLVSWARGCGYTGKVSPFDGNASLPWKVEWAAKFTVFGVDVEGAGKDHSTKGGSRDIANIICREVFRGEPPFNVPYEFFNVGGKKMSSSKGAGSSAREISDLLDPAILRLLLLGKDFKRVIDFVPDGDAVPILYDTYDKFAASYFAGEESDWTRIFSLIHTPKDRASVSRHFLPRFSQMSFLVQMPHMNLEEEVRSMKGEDLTDADKKEIVNRSDAARRWLEAYAGEDFVYKLQEDAVPEAAKNFSQEQKDALKLILEYVRGRDELDGQEMHAMLHDVKEKSGIAPRDLFSALYISFLGKESGPKAGWFLSVLDKKFLEKRLGEVSE